MKFDLQFAHHCRVSVMAVSISISLRASFVNVMPQLSNTHVHIVQLHSFTFKNSSQEF